MPWSGQAYDLAQVRLVNKATHPEDIFLLLLLLLLLLLSRVSRVRLCATP